ncbi:MAG: hypothetical protein GY725_17585 [bacterium]|nr:hypothetical protein [bacterium]
MTIIAAASLFVLSGALGLGYQLIWIQKAALLVGSSQIALSTVVTSFFLGLALGSIFAGRYLRTRRLSPLFVYGLFEAAIGIFALAFPFFFGLVEDVYGLAYPLIQASPSALFALRFALLFVLFLIPTFFMGGTLPLLLDGLVERDQAVGSLTSLLYGLNIVGAVVGVLATAYICIPVLGQNGTTFYAGLGNLAIAAVALTAFAKKRPVHEYSSEPVQGSALGFIVLAFASGFASLGYQMSWARYLGLLTNAWVYQTAVLLAVFLSALAVGSLILSLLLRAGLKPLRLLAFIQPIVPLLVFGSLGLYTAIPYGYQAPAELSSLEVDAFWAILSEEIDATLLVPAFRTAMVLFLPVCLIGMGLPALIAGATARSESLRATAGDLVFWNTLGSSAGGFVMAYAVIPAVGLSGSFLGLAVLSIAIGLGATYLTQSDGRSRMAVVLGVAALVVSLYSMRTDITRDAIVDLVPRFGPSQGGKIVEIVEGPLTTGWATRSSEGMVIGARSVDLAKVRFDRATGQAIQAHFPFLFYPGKGIPKRALGIALGSGQSFGGALMYPIEQFDVVDISTEIVALSLKHFAQFNHGLADDPRVKFHFDDGRHFVSRAPSDYYDIVETEPPPPADEGVYTLYSYEFYQDARRVMRENGVFMQWIPLYLMTGDDFKSLMATQTAVFPQTFLIRDNPDDLMAVSFKRDSPPLFDLDQIRDRIQVFSKERKVAGHRWTSRSQHDLATIEGVLSLIIFGPEEAAEIRAPLLHEDDQLLSYGFEDRHLMRKFLAEPGKMSSFSFAEMPMTPFSSLARYFAQEIPVDELDDERVRGLPEHYGVTVPSEIRRLEARFAQESESKARARVALELAKRFDAQLDKTRALEWVRNSMEASWTLSDPASIGIVREIATHGLSFQADLVAEWLGGLPESLRHTSIAGAMEKVLEDYVEREDRRASRYLLRSRASRNSKRIKRLLEGSSPEAGE